MSYLDRLRKQEKISERATPPTDKTDKTPLLSVLAVPHQGHSEKIAPIKGTRPVTLPPAVHGIPLDAIRQWAGDDWPELASNPDLLAAYVRAAVETGELTPPAPDGWEQAVRPACLVEPTGGHIPPFVDPRSLEREALQGELLPSIDPGRERIAGLFDGVADLAVQIGDHATAATARQQARVARREGKP